MTIELHAFDTPNGRKISVALEEMGLPYNVVVVDITKGQLDFGPWEQVHYAEFDGQRKKRVLVKIIGE